MIASLDVGGRKGRQGRPKIMIDNVNYFVMHKL